MWISPASPDDPDSLELVRRHRAHSAEHSVNPADDHVLDIADLTGPDVAFFGLRDGAGELLAVAALRHLSADHAELKSMHTRSEARGRGLGRALLDHLMDEARARGYTRLSLETGTQPGFAAARRLYASAGFTPCPPFGAYTATANNVYYTREL